ncbi:hypothetical protein SeMB42_g04788 [Synchytrium endobioticum]|uniref:Integrase catalytic domain-containing protein n=1 Tax=Synchytrium endobioticum TaxID=286115 RepID=A0A507CVU0_9FUNG|nr:hypothetical protein SeMB42_g04788 [Synchytrium endobioticum]
MREQQEGKSLRTRLNRLYVVEGDDNTVAGEGKNEIDPIAQYLGEVRILTSEARSHRSQFLVPFTISIPSKEPIIGEALLDSGATSSCMNAVFAENTKFHWGPKEQEAFEKIKEILTADVFLMFPDHEKPFYLFFDSSDLGTGAVLQQEDEFNRLRPIEYYSYKWNKSEYNYSTPDKELYGLILALKHWYHLLFGSKHTIFVQTDHKSLRDFSKTQLLKPRHARWSLILEDYRGRLKIQWVRGKLNVVADVLSRDPSFALTGKEFEERKSFQVLPDDMLTETEDTSTTALDNVLFEVDKDLLEIQDNEEDGSETASDTDGTTSPLDGSTRYCQPHQTDVSGDSEYQKNILELHHDSALAGHGGFRKTLEIILRKYWWKGIRTSVKTYIKECDQCQRGKGSTQSPMGKLKPLPIPEQNWLHITMDFIVKLPQSRRDENDVFSDSILVVVDRRSKMAHFIPTTESITAEQTARLVFDRIVCQHGVPRTILSDRGPQFRSHFWKAFLQLIGSKAVLTTAYHPEGDGQSERVNQMVESYLRLYSTYDQDKWVTVLPQAEFAYNNSHHTSIGMSPFMANFGYDLGLEFLEKGVELNPTWEVPSAKSLKDHFAKIQENLQLSLQTAQECYKKYADETRRPEEEFDVGQEVMISTKNLRTKRPSRKLEDKWIGPYYIKRKISPVTFEVHLPKNLRIHPIFHIHLLKRYHRSTDPNRALVKTPPIALEDQEGWIINDIIDVRTRRGKFEYLIDWKDFPPESRTWEPRHSLDDDSMLKEWHRRNPRKKSPFPKTDMRENLDEGG